MVKLSKRLLAVANLVSAGNVLADVGTDHAYLPIYLVQQKMISKAIALDVNKGPLSYADANIKANQVARHITTRCANGLMGIEVGEVDTVSICGMGGNLTIRILSERMEVVKKLKELILQPQSMLVPVRKFLRQEGLTVLEEDMVFEDGKYYQVMRAVPNMRLSKEAWISKETQVIGETQRLPEAQAIGEKQRLPEAQALSDVCVRVAESFCEVPDTLEDRYGAFLLKNRHPILQQYLQKQQEKLEMILKNLDTKAKPETGTQRRQEVASELEGVKKALEIMHI
ncbi:class I SAM-dependent methyltransferase [Lachnospiraceae bacterium ZAX-1]